MSDANPTVDRSVAVRLWNAFLLGIRSVTGAVRGSVNCAPVWDRHVRPVMSGHAADMVRTRSGHDFMSGRTSRPAFLGEKQRWRVRGLSLNGCLNYFDQYVYNVFWNRWGGGGYVRTCPLVRQCYPFRHSDCILSRYKAVWCALLVQTHRSSVFLPKYWSDSSRTGGIGSE